MSNYIVLNNQSDEETLVSKINQCSFIGKYLTEEELDFMLDCIEEDKSEFIIFETGFLINSIKREGGKLIYFGRFDGVNQIGEVTELGIFIRNETRVIEREGIDPHYDKLLKSLVGYHEGALESAIWIQHISYYDDYIPEMEFSGESIRSLMDGGVTDEKHYMIVIKENENEYIFSTVAFAYHKSGHIARSQSNITVSSSEAKKIIEVINQ